MAPRRHLGPQLRSLLRSAPRLVHQLAPQLGGVRDLQQGEGDGAPDGDGQAAHPVHFLDRGDDVLSGHSRGSQLEDPCAQLAEGGPDPEQLVLGRVGPGDRLAVDGAVGDGTGGGETQGARRDRIPDDGAHGGDVVGARRLVARPALAHYVGPHRAVGDLRPDVDGEAAPRQNVEVLGEALPLPRDAFGQRRAGDVLDAFHQADEPVMAVGARRCEADAAVPGDDGRHPVPRTGGEDLVPGGLAVVVRMDVDPTGRDQRAVGVDGPVGRHPVERAHGDDLSVVHRHVSGAGRCSRAIHDGAASYHQIVHRAPPRQPSWWLACLHGGIGPSPPQASGTSVGHKRRRGPSVGFRTGPKPYRRRGGWGWTGRNGTRRRGRISPSPTPAG